MAVPFHRLKACGSILVAARGASIHTFNITDGSHIAAWQVPQPAEKEEEKPEEKREEEAAPPPAEETEEAAEAEGGDDEPPSKRRRTDETEEDKDNTDGQEQEQQQPQQENNANGNSNHDKKKKKHRSKAKPKPKQAPTNKPVALRTADLPVVSILEATADGRHLVVMMGHDKTLRVLSHDLQGHLTQLSARVMPKRPCAVAFTADEQTILSGDKFGDVYALPLIEVEKTEEEKAAEKAAKEAAATAEKEAADKKAQEEAIVAPLRLEANKFTVHTKGNRQALENQRRQKELLLQQGLDPQKKDLEASSSEYQLLLGHVSMLTAVAVAEGYLEGEYQKGSGTTKKARRPLILTADRDEHIRVTRGVVGPTAATSQTHVIETFCLGHTSFVSRLCIPASRPDRLVSGGGDGELRVWSFWPEGRLVGTADLASLVASVSSSSSGGAEAKVALSGLYAFGSKAASDPDAMTDEAVSDAFIVAICER